MTAPKQTPAEIARVEVDALWRKNIRHDDVRAIDMLFRDGIGWIPDDREYCTSLVAYGYRRHIPAEVRKYGFASGYRLDRLVRGLSIGKWKPPPERWIERIAVEDVRPGDFMTVRTKRRQPYGDHTVFVIGIVYAGKALALDVFITTEANATGTGPYGATFRGIVHGRRKPSEVVRAYRVVGAHEVKL